MITTGLSVEFRSNFPELTQTLEKVEKLPKKFVTKAARKGANVVLKPMRAAAPKNTGTLRKALYLKKEWTKINPKTKTVFDVRFRSSAPLAKNSKYGKRSYYPASQEYGYYTVKGKKHTSHAFVDGKRTYTMEPVESGEKKPGLEYMKKTAETTGPAAIQTIIQTLTTELEKEWAKQQEVLHDGF